MILALVLVGCNLPDPQEATRLKTENETLQAQVSALTSERDAAVLERDDLRGRLEKIKTALENLPSSSSMAISTPSPAPTVPETTAPTVPETTVPLATTPPEVIPAPKTPTPTAPETTPAPATPDSSTLALPPVSAGADASALEKLQVYANEVLTAAQNFKAQTRQEAPLNCTNGYAAGAYNVQDSLDLKECSIVAQTNGDYRVTARDAAGNSVSVP
jgi:hypothetical protein